jgi:tetratricopeptide (TPR) repeat protein
VNGWRQGVLARFVFLSVLSATVLAASVLATPQAHAAKKDKKEAGKTKTDPRELQAREAFAAGRYREALDVYAKLYAEKLHPTYLRNIGRCHQHMGNPDEAILSFRDYLRKAADLPASEKQEVEGFISEMQAMKDKQKAEQAHAQNPQPAVAVVPTTPPVVQGGTGTPEPAAKPAGLDLQGKPTPEPESNPPIYKKAWFWVATGAVVAAGVVGGLWAGGVFSSSDCRAGYVCK